MLAITDAFLLASAPNDRQVKAIVDEVEERLRTELDAKPVRREGERDGRWVLLDYVDIVVHVQHAQERVFYALERLWKDCPETAAARRRAGHAGQGRRARRRPRHGRGRGRRPQLTAAAGPSATGRRVVLWRHGQTGWNLERRFQGTTDIPLTESGVAQARRAARLLAALRPDAVVSSDLRRAARTAAELTALTGLEPRFYEDLRETYAGDWQGLTSAEVRARHGETYAAWKRGEPVRRGGGELETEVADRTAPVVLREVDKLPPNGTLVVVSHGGAIRVTLGRLLGLEPPQWESLGGLSNCCWSVLGEGARGWRLLEHNAGSLPEQVLGVDDD